MKENCWNRVIVGCLYWKLKSLFHFILSDLCWSERHTYRGTSYLPKSSCFFKISWGNYWTTIVLTLFFIFSSFFLGHKMMPPIPLKNNDTATYSIWNSESQKANIKLGIFKKHWVNCYFSINYHCQWKWKFPPKAFLTKDIFGKDIYSIINFLRFGALKYLITEILAFVYF